MKRLHTALLSVSLLSFMIGCGSDDSTPPLIPEITSIQIQEYNTTQFIYALDNPDDSAVTNSGQLYATINYSDGRSSTSTSQLDWESNNSDIISVHNGLTLALANNGTVEISASYRNKLFTVDGEQKQVRIIPVTDSNISSDDPLLSIRYDLNNSSSAIVDINDSGPYQLLLNGTFEDNKTTSNISSNLKWTSSNISIASVGITGLVTLIYDQNATVSITASLFDEVNATLELNITK